MITTEKIKRIHGDAVVTHVMKMACDGCGKDILLYHKKFNRTGSKLVWTSPDLKGYYVFDLNHLVPRSKPELQRVPWKYSLNNYFINSQNYFINSQYHMCSKECSESVLFNELLKAQKI